MEVLLRMFSLSSLLLREGGLAGRDRVSTSALGVAHYPWEQAAASFWLWGLGWFRFSQVDSLHASLPDLPADKTCLFGGERREGGGSHPGVLVTGTVTPPTPLFPWGPIQPGRFQWLRVHQRGCLREGILGPLSQDKHELCPE